MPKSIEQLRRDAKALKKAYEARDREALRRVEAHPPRADGRPLKHADFLHVIARESGFESWPRLVWAEETIGLDRAAKLQRLKIALAHGQIWRAERLLADTPDLAEGHFGLQCALYDRAAVAVALAEDPEAALRLAGPRRPILHLAFSKWIHARPELEADMLTVAEMLVAHGADVNDSYAQPGGEGHLLSALYGAIGHANNMVLGRWLLDRGADPNDGESLYHATELGHHEGLRMLIAAGADPRGTNALLRALDFDDADAVRMLLGAGADVEEFNDAKVGGATPRVIPALHQAARRMCGPEAVSLLLEAGADPLREFAGATAWGYARVFGNRALAEAIEARHGALPLTREETLLAAAAEGRDTEGQFVDPARLPPAYRNLLREIVHMPDKLDQMRRLVALGLEYDAPDAEGLTPVQVAGWSGLPEAMGYFLSLKPDLSHVNGYGGTLLTTIVHGSENCPERAERDYLACLELALSQGVALPRGVIDGAGEPEVAAFLAGWAAAHPGQVVPGE